MSVTANIVLKLQTLFPGINFIKDVVVQDDGNGPYIAAWRRQEPMPTEEELNAPVVEAKKGLFDLPPTVEEQLKMIYTDMKNKTNTFVETMDKYVN